MLHYAIHIVKVLRARIALNLEWVGVGLSRLSDPQFCRRDMILGNACHRYPKMFIFVKKFVFLFLNLISRSPITIHSVYIIYEKV
jgi:hypothetical protein